MSRLVSSNWIRVGIFALSAVALFAVFSVAQAQESGSIGDAIWGGVLRGIATILFAMVQAFNILLGWTGMFFNQAMLFTVFNFSYYLGNTPELLTAWSILRDLANIGLLFGFVYIGVKVILEAETFSTGKALPSLLIFAALVNFSLFAGEAVIDVSNALGSAAYAQATSVNCRTPENGQECANSGIAAVVFQVSGLSTMVGAGGIDLEDLWSGNNNASGTLGVTFALMAFVVTMAFVLGAATLMLIARAITLMILLVLSPIGFAGMALPGFQKYAQDWWHALINNAIFAPAFVILLLVGLKIVEGLNNAFAQGDQNILEAFTQPGGNVGGLLVTFAIAIGFIIGALMTAQQLSIYGSKQVVGAATKAIGTVVGGTVLYPLGMVSNGLSRMYNQAGRVVRRNTPAPLRFAANLLGASALDKVVRTGLKAPGSIALPGGMNSYNTMRTESAARRKEMTEMDRKQAGKGFMDNIGLGENDNDKEKEAREKEAKKVVDAKKFQTDFSSAVAKVRANKDDTDDLEVLVNKMSVSAFKDLPQNINNSAEVEEMAKVMSSSKFKQIMDEKEGVSDKVKKRMKDARYNLLKDQAEKARAGNPDERKKLRQWSTDDLVASGALADDQKRIDLVHTLSDTQFDALVKSNDVPSGMKQKLRDLRDGTGSGARFGDSNSARIAIEGMDTPEIMKIKASTLVDRNVIEHIPPTALAEISKANKSFNPAERQALVSHVTQVAARTAGTPEQQDALEDYLLQITGTPARARFRTYYGI